MEISEIIGKPIKGLTLTQPWAMLLAYGYHFPGLKRLETRDWGTSYRGPVAIHAAQGFPSAAQRLCFTEPFKSALLRVGIDHYSQLPRGKVQAVHNLVDIKTVAEGHQVLQAKLQGSIEFKNAVGAPLNPYMLPPGFPEVAFGDYSIGRKVWFFEKGVLLPRPYQYRGALSLWDFVYDL